LLYMISEVYKLLLFFSGFGFLEINLEKLKPKRKKITDNLILEDFQKRFIDLLIRFISGAVIFTLLSWIFVITFIFGAVVALVSYINEILYLPESIKEIEYPLKSNFHLLPEYVWAYDMYLKIKKEEVDFDQYLICSKLKDTGSLLEKFSTEKALMKFISISGITDEEKENFKGIYFSSLK